MSIESARSLFERWWMRQSGAVPTDIFRDANDRYFGFKTKQAWKAWHAAAAAEREACVGLLLGMRARSRNPLFRSALTIAAGALRARGDG